jgi:NAD(P)-dependent dehydrogenase (short-subunit alcohol dehydrogenase family)
MSATPSSTATPAVGRLQNQVALVTGGSSGIGRATAEALIGEGARVALISRREPELGAVASELGDSAFAFPADITRPDDVASMVARVDEELDGIDIVVNSAGLAIALPLAETDADVWRAVIDTNLSGTYYIAREAGLRMVANRGGSIVNVGSEMSMQGMETLSAYCASKHGIIGLTKALACELAPTVRVNAVCPGPTETPMLNGYIDAAEDPQAVRDMTMARIRLNRFGGADELAAGILYMLTAPQATGAVLNLDGGSTL